MPQQRTTGDCVGISFRATCITSHREYSSRHETHPWYPSIRRKVEATAPEQGAMAYGSVTMNFTLRHAIAAILVLLSIAVPVAAGPLEDGNAAYKRGDYKTAMRILRPLADQGDGMAEAIVGLMYKNNFGVPLDM
jgi:hypothetical protein